MRRVTISMAALKDLKRWPQAEQLAVRAAVRGFAQWPECRNVKSLSGREGYRLRVGRYRVLFEVREKEIFVTEVKKRDERTYN